MIEIRWPDGLRAELRNGNWTCDDPDRREWLRVVTRVFETSVRDYQPNRDLALAEFCASWLSARVASGARSRPRGRTVEPNGRLRVF